ncbi:MAG: polyprenyl synthetase family protein [Thermoanaerobaculum sp.]|nr:polyprenyl synthetase family protein [Thermoanaerobaculum sp.]MDW7968497.1 polyprenyl synthetase family protein [Thermoanaerobaculum sp.]
MLEDFLAEERRKVEQALEAVLPPEHLWPQELHRAMRYAVLAGGKRLRPILFRWGHALAGGNPEEVTFAACGVELIHTYSLVHDDLPAMDNDTLRRGKPTVHVVFGEALAILAGDALLTEGFRLLATYPQGERWAAGRGEVCRLLAEAVGSRGMVGGQVEDLQAMGKEPDPQRLQRLHLAKTAQFLAACLVAGAVLAGAPAETCNKLHRFGLQLGLAFQIADDLLDVTGCTEELGKTAGKDQIQDKLTYPKVYGLAASWQALQDLTGGLMVEAGELDPTGKLQALVEFVGRRRA